MLSRFTDYFKKNYSSSDLPFEYRIFMIFFTLALFISVVSMSANFGLHGLTLGVAFQMLYIVFSVAVFFFPLSIRLKMIKPLALFVAFIYLPFMFFETGGYTGTSLMFVMLAIFMLALILKKGKGKILALLLMVTVYLGLSVFQYTTGISPDGSHIIAPLYGMGQIVDLCVALVVTFVGFSILAIYVNNAYERERQRNIQLIDELADYNSKLEDISMRDPLTGIFNRRYLTSFLAEHLSQDVGRPLTILMMDLDHFKQVNDTHGHSIGDLILMRFAQTVQSELRSSDIFARYGGEEFVAVLTNTNADVGFEISERLRKKVAGMKSREGVMVTVSIGLAEHQPEETLDHLLSHADKMLYKAKSQGRNQTVAG